MKKKITKSVAGIAIAAGLVASVFAPWWVVWLVCLPVIVAGLIYILSELNYIKTY